MVDHERWKSLVLDPGDEGQVWELFHENSKRRKHSGHPSDEEVHRRVSKLEESLPFEAYPIIELPTQLVRVTLSLEEAIKYRTSVRDLTPRDLSLCEVATFLHFSYGVARPSTNNFPRPFRFVPSAGALYPLEIFFYSAHIQNLQPGIYHYNPGQNHLRQYRDGEYSQELAEGLIQSDLVSKASLILFITAFFERAVFKYDNRGYRFTFLEAGHLAQNLNLVLNGLHLSCINIGGYFDNHIDDLLGLNGLTQSTIYMMAIGGKPE